MAQLRSFVSLVSACGLFTACSAPGEEEVHRPDQTSEGSQPLLGEQLWEEVTTQAFGAASTGGWTHKLELADVDVDGNVDLLFANGGAYHTPVPFSQLHRNRLLLNQGADENGIPKFLDVSLQVFKDTDPDRNVDNSKDYARSIKVRDVTADGRPDIVIGTAYHKGPNRIFVGQEDGSFVEETAERFPPGTASVGDLEIGDVNGDGHLDIVLANWGVGDPCVLNVPGCFQVFQPQSPGGRVQLWLNDGTGVFTDHTDKMPEDLIRFSWDLELVDVDNDLDLDVVVASKATLGDEGSYLYINDGSGEFTNVSRGPDALIETDDALPQRVNNYEFEVIDFDGDGDMDLLTFNDGDQQTPGPQAIFDLREHLFENNGDGTFSDATAKWWPEAVNIGEDDNHGAVFDFDNDGDQDFLIGSLFGNGSGEQNQDGDERLMVNEGGASLSMKPRVLVGEDDEGTPGTLGVAVADLNGDNRPDVVQSQGESDDEERVYIATEKVAVDTQAPIVGVTEGSASGQVLTVVGRAYDRKTPVQDSDFEYTGDRYRTPFLKLKHAKRKTFIPGLELPMTWAGGTLWRARVDLAELVSDESTLPAKAKKGLSVVLKKGTVIYQICAVDRAGNEACGAESEMLTLVGRE